MPAYKIRTGYVTKTFCSRLRKLLAANEVDCYYGPAYDYRQRPAGQNMCVLLMFEDDLERFRAACDAYSDQYPPDTKYSNERAITDGKKLGMDELQQNRETKAYSRNAWNLL